jgi:hypothetical protein
MLALCINLLLATSAWADGARTMPVIVRSQGQLVPDRQELTDLTSDSAFDGRYFKVVHAQDETPIAFTNSDSQVVLRAATAYFYMTRAREAYLKLLGDQPQLSRKMTIRIDQDKDYSEVTHFSHQAVKNGALSIDASDPRDALDGLQWDPETWFFVAEKTRFAAGAEIGTAINSPEFKEQLLFGLLQQDATTSAQDILANRFYFEPHLYSVAVTFGLSELLPIVLDQAVRHIKTTVYVDTAMIPEIIIHEYGHHALGPWFGFKQRTHLVEGYPNYFAGKILGLVRLQDHAGPYSSGYAPRRGDSGAKYSLDEEYGPDAATSSFVFTLLNDLDAALGDRGQAVVIRALDYIDRSSTLKPDFENAVMRAVSEMVPGSQAALLKASNVFISRGM